MHLCGTFVEELMQKVSAFSRGYEIEGGVIVLAVVFECALFWFLAESKVQRATNNPRDLIKATKPKQIAAARVFIGRQ